MPGICLSQTLGLKDACYEGVEKPELSKSIIILMSLHQQEIVYRDPQKRHLAIERTEFWILIYS